MSLNGDHSISTAVFGFVESLVSAFNRTFDIVIAETGFGNADTDCKWNHRIIGLFGQFLEHDAQTFGNTQGVIQLGFRQDANEFLTTQPTKYVNLTQLTKTNFCKSFQGDVTSRVTMRIIDDLEVVDIHDQNRDGPIETETANEFLVAQRNQIATR